MRIGTSAGSEPHASGGRVVCAGIILCVSALCRWGDFPNPGTVGDLDPACLGRGPESLLMKVSRGLSHFVPGPGRQRGVAPPPSADLRPVATSLDQGAGPCGPDWPIPRELTGSR